MKIELFVAGKFLTIDRKNGQQRTLEPSYYDFFFPSLLIRVLTWLKVGIRSVVGRLSRREIEIDFLSYNDLRDGSCGLELTRIWSKGSMYLAPVQGALRSCVHRTQGPITEELSAIFVGHLVQVYMPVYAQFLRI